jgi:hypothetical protein
MGICLAAIMTCVRLKLRGNAQKQVVGGGESRKITIPLKNRPVHT